MFMQLKGENYLKKARVKKGSIRVIAAFMTMVFAIGTLNIKAKAQEIADYNEATTSVVVKNEGFGNDYGAQPLTTMFDCENILAFTLEGLEMTFTTSCVDVASVIGVKDIKVQQKMWYGWKTVMTSNGGENYNQEVFGGDLTYPDAVNGKTYRVICTHYANYDVYEEVENDTGAFKFVL
mgnify:FL=1